MDAAIARYEREPAGRFDNSVEHSGLDSESNELALQDHARGCGTSLLPRSRRRVVGAKVVRVALGS